MRVFLGILGALLLLPGACGALFYGFLANEAVTRNSIKFAEYSEIFWGISVPSLNLGLFGLWLLSNNAGKPWLRQAALWTAIVVLLLNIATLAIVLAQPDATVARDWPGYLMVAVLFLGSWLPGGLLSISFRNRD